MEQLTKTARNVCFTLNNYTEMEYKDISEWDVKYMVVGKEIGESGTPHLQGYVEYKSSKKWAIIKASCYRAHWEPRKGSAAQASTYCKKEGDFIEKGEISNQGKRSDLDEVKDLLDSKCSMKEVADEHFGSWVRYNKSFDKYVALSNTDRMVPPEAHWRWGTTATGKTSYCFENYNRVYIKDGTSWWDGYDQGYDCICVDDFDGKWPYRDLLRFMDRYPYQGQFKGGYVKINTPLVVITCEHPPDHFWSGNELAQVTRRLSYVTMCKDKDHVTDYVQTGDDYYYNYTQSQTRYDPATA